MKIAYFADAYKPQINGMTISVEAFAKAFSKEHEIMIFAPGYGRKEVIEKEGRIVIRRYPSFVFPSYKDWQVATPDIGEILKATEEFNPDIIHFHSPGPLGMLGILAAKKLKKPLVGTYHTLFSETLVYISPAKLLERYIRYIDRVVSGLGLEVNRQKNVDKPGEETLSKKITWSLLNRIYKYCDVVICPSGAIKRELSKRGMEVRMEVVSNGLDLKRFPPKKEYKQKQVILHAGRLGYEKKIDVVLDAFKLVLTKCPEAILWIAGGGPADESLKKKAEKNGISGKVRFLGMVDRKELAKIYREADVFVTASTMETQGLVILEAMASGLPVVGVKAFAVPDVVKHGTNGYLVMPGGAKDMAEKTAKILQDLKLQKKMGKASREAAQKHDITICVRKMEKVYRSLSVKERLTFRERIKWQIARVWQQG